jgi:hypothetical protein
MATPQPTLPSIWELSIKILMVCGDEAKGNRDGKILRLKRGWHGLALKKMYVSSLQLFCINQFINNVTQPLRDKLSVVDKCYEINVTCHFCILKI